MFLERQFPQNLFWIKFKRSYPLCGLTLAH
jgi:hypothetical protein